MSKTILITGGQRSGKSVYAEQLALSLSDNPVYMATAHIWDEDFRERVRVHQQRRGPQWTNIEEEKYLSKHELTGRVILVDCLTLWATNFFFEGGDDSEGEMQTEASILDEMKKEFDKFTMQDSTFIFVTNEIGMGGTSSSAVQRRFTDLLGALNQYVAAKAEEVTLMVSGIAVNIKGVKGHNLKN